MIPFIRFSFYLIVASTLASFQNTKQLSTADELTGSYYKQYTLGVNKQITKKLTIKNGGELIETIKVKSNNYKRKYDRKGNWSLRGDTLILMSRKDDWRDCGYNANYYEKKCTNDTLIFKEKGLWSIKPIYKEYSKQ